MKWNLLLTPLTGLISDWFKSRNLKSEKKYQLKVLQAKAEIDKAKQEHKAESNYDLVALQSMRTTWKDEYLVLVLTFPFIVSFLIPFIELYTGQNLTNSLEKAWKLVALAPEWYQIILIGIVVATFGLRWYTRSKGFMNHAKRPANPVQD